MAGTGPDGAWTEAVRLATIPREQKKRKKKEKKRTKIKGKNEEGKMNGVKQARLQDNVWWGGTVGKGVGVGGGGGMTL